jgi:hypothetical protein
LPSKEDFQKLLSESGEGRHQYDVLVNGEFNAFVGGGKLESFWSSTGDKHFAVRLSFTSHFHRVYLNKIKKDNYGAIRCLQD